MKAKACALILLTLPVACDSHEARQVGAPPAAEGTIAPEPAEAEGPTWAPLFNGKDMSGWTPKFSGSPLGENLLDTFRVEDGLLRVSYDKYESFDARFGHLFFDGEFSNYDLRVVYRFVGDQCPGGPGWARRNNGMMVHGQRPETMGLDQDFPVSIEAQMLGEADGGGVRANGSLCTPGTNVEVAGELKMDHCISSNGPTNYGDEWVEMFIEVRGNESIRHLINGESVMEYGAPQLDERDKDAQALIAAGASIPLDRGTISLQAESHGIDFKTIEILVLDGE